MALVISTVGVMHFPAIANPQTAVGDAVVGSPPSTLGTPNPTANAAAGCLGALSVNGINIGGSGGSAGATLVDLTTWGAKELISFINGANTGAVASVNRDGRLVLSSPAGVPITIAGGATLLAALGLTAGVTNN